MNRPRISRLLGFARELQRAATFEDLLIITQAELSAAVGYQHAWLFVAHSEDAKEWHLLDYAGAKKGIVWEVAPVLKIEGDAMLEEIATSDEPVVVADARTDPRTDKRIVEQLGNRTIVNVPLRLLDKPFGALGTGTFGDAEGCRPPTPEQLEYLIGMASQLAVAAGRIRLLEERRRTEETLRKSEEELRITLHSIGDAVIATDAHGRVVRMNPVAEQLTGWSLADAKDQNLSQIFRIIDETTREPVESPVERVLREGVVVGLANHTALIARDGSERAIADSGAPIRDDNGALRGVVLVFHDQTRERQAERALEQLLAELEARVARRTAALETANRELDAFSYSVAHDLRAPLRTIAGFSRALIEDYASTLAAQAQSYLSRIIAGVDRMGETIDALLALSKLSRTELHRQEVDLSRLAQSVIDELRATEPERAVSFVARHGVTAWGDPQLLRALLQNLLGNAWKFTGERSVARIEFGSVENDGGSVFFVRDNGAGFKMAQAKRLFVPFQRLHSVTQFEGTGVGLATVQRIVQLHGGRVWAEAIENEGATFRFTLSEAASSDAL